MTDRVCPRSGDAFNPACGSHWFCRRCSRREQKRCSAKQAVDAKTLRGAIRLCRPDAQLAEGRQQAEEIMMRLVPVAEELRR